LGSGPAEAPAAERSTLMKFSLLLSISGRTSFGDWVLLNRSAIASAVNMGKALVTAR